MRNPSTHLACPSPEELIYKGNKQQPLLRQINLQSETIQAPACDTKLTQHHKPPSFTVLAQYATLFHKHKEIHHLLPVTTAHFPYFLTRSTSPLSLGITCSLSALTNSYIETKQARTARQCPGRSKARHLSHGTVQRITHTALAVPHAFTT
ncbi:hypothetical protein EK904_006106 [Melospiza melodia maxima]|nr:hypothetical protein EK904_006106 [Melospiza melodia maxima]